MTEPSTETKSVAERLRGFGPVGIAAIVVILAASVLFMPLGAVLVLVWARQSATPMRELGFARPPSIARDLLVAIALGVGLKVVLKAIVMPLFGAPAINPIYHYIAGNAAALPGILSTVIVASFVEEVVFRGYLFERLGRLLGDRTGAKLAIVLVTSGLFGLAHLRSQGVFGAEQSVISGLVFGTIFAVTRRLWIPIAAHLAFDITAVAIIYFDVETTIARFLFN
jgi:membrane protease YdiL (CAAX protease family)